MPTVTFRNELNDDKIGYPSYVPRATHRFTFDSTKVALSSISLSIERAPPIRNSLNPS